MANINNEASNTQRMREHMTKKYSQLAAPSLEETDLIMCSQVVNLGNSVALNRNVAYADLVTVLLANPNDLALVSDVDNQLLLKVNFKDPVTCTSVCFRAETPPTQPINSQPEGDEAANSSNQPDEGEAVSSSNVVNPSSCSGPRKINCFANNEDLDFVDTESVNAAQVIELQRSQLEFTFLNRLCLWGRTTAHQMEL